MKYFGNGLNNPFLQLNPIQHNERELWKSNIRLEIVLADKVNKINQLLPFYFISFPGVVSYSKKEAKDLLFTWTCTCITTWLVKYHLLSLLTLLTGLLSYFISSNYSNVCLWTLINFPYSFFLFPISWQKRKGWCFSTERSYHKRKLKLEQSGYKI